MWFDGPGSDEDQDEAYPFFPVDTGSPIAAAMAVVCFVGLLAAIFMFRT